MTSIVGIEYGGKVLLGGDIQGTGGNCKVIHTQPKVFNKSGVAFGWAGSYRFGQILEHELSNPVIPEDDAEIYRWLVTILVPNIRKILKDNGCDDGGNCLIGVKGQLWELQSDFSVIRSTIGYAAVGSGAEYAIGSVFTALHIRRGLPKTLTAAKTIVKNAILAAGTFCPSVGTDSEVIST